MSPLKSVALGLVVFGYGMASAGLVRGQADDASGSSSGSRLPLDQVWVVPAVKPSEWQGYPLEHRQGHILGFSANGMQWSNAEDPTQEEAPAADNAREKKPAAADIPFDRIARWDIAWHESTARDAIRLDREGKPVDAARQWLVAATETQSWKRWPLIAKAWQPLYEARQYQPVLEVIGQNAPAEKVPVLLAQLPIQWLSNPVPSDLPAAVSARLEDPKPLVRLVAASWLLENAQATEADKALVRLIDAKNSLYVRQLATAVRWRLASVDVIKQQAAMWADQIDQMPFALQGGPRLALGECWEKSGDSERALESYLAGILLYPEPRSQRMLAATHVLRLLRKLGRDEDAEAFKQAIKER